MKRLLYLCRYTLGPKASGVLFECGIAAERKINGIGEVFIAAGIRPILLVTPVAPVFQIWRKTEVRRADRKILIIPFAVNIGDSRMLSYGVNILISAIFAGLLVARRRFFASLTYNLMPDTVLPAMMARLTGGRMLHMLELEEDISEDHEAPSLFRTFDRLARRHVRFDAALVASSVLRRSVQARCYQTFHGFAMPAEIEVSRPGPFASSEPGVRRVAFIGRLDSMRCILEFLDATLALAEAGVQMRVEVIGYSDDANLLKKIDAKVDVIRMIIPITVSVSAPRSRVLDTLLNSDVCVSLVRDAAFLERSFPSKLIEYLLYDRIIVSQKVNDLAEIDNFVWIKSPGIDSICEGLKQAFLKLDMHEVRPMAGRQWVLDNCTVSAGAEKLKQVLSHAACAKGRL
jgi:hypothetical protein